MILTRLLHTKVIYKSQVNKCTAKLTNTKKKSSEKKTWNSPKKCIYTNIATNKRSNDDGNVGYDDDDANNVHLEKKNTNDNKNCKVHIWRYKEFLLLLLLFETMCTVSNDVWCFWRSTHNRVNWMQLS